jgi:hypothetical protein
MPQMIGGAAKGDADAADPPMDEPKYELPAWLPWATTACLAALVACLAELHFIERSRAELLREQAELAQSAVMAAQNQLEAERILDARQLKDLGGARGSGAVLQVILLRPTEPGAPERGVAVLDPASGRGQLSLFGEFRQPPERDFQLWVDGPGTGNPAACGVFHLDQAGDGEPVGIRATVAPGCRLVLIDGAKGGSGSLAQAQAEGSIILASSPYQRRN